MTDTLRVLSDAGREQLSIAGARGGQARWLPPPFWTAERHQQCEAMWKEGKSAGIIAEALGTTRNAVIGRLHRHGLCRTQSTPTVVRERTVRARNRARMNKNNNAERKRVKPLEILNGQVNAADIHVYDNSEVQRSLNISLIDRTSAQCGWICDDDCVPALCCGHPTADGSFCRYHASVAYRPVRRAV